MNPVGRLKNKKMPKPNGRPRIPLRLVRKQMPATPMAMSIEQIRATAEHLSTELGTKVSMGQLIDVYVATVTKSKLEASIRAWHAVAREHTDKPTMQQMLHLGAANLSAKDIF